MQLVTAGHALEGESMERSPIIAIDYPGPRVGSSSEVLIRRKERAEITPEAVDSPKHVRW